MGFLEVRCKKCDNNVVENGFYMISKDVYKVSNRSESGRKVEFSYSEDYDNEYYCYVCNEPIKNEDRNKLLDLIEK